MPDPQSTIASAAPLTVVSAVPLDYRAEARAVDESTMAHLPSIPETPIKRRVRRTKAQMAAAKG